MQSHWPIWFGEDFNQKLTQGQMIDISSKAGAFSCYAFESDLFRGQDIATYFSVPIYGPKDSFAIRDFKCSGRILRIDCLDDMLLRIITQFTEILSFKPGEQVKAEPDFVSMLKGMLN